jgi:hypothetical protein
MKKILLSVAMLLTLASLSYAADKKQTAVKRSVENKGTLSINSTVVAAANYAAVMEENNMLRLQTAELSKRVDELNSKIQYSDMMFITINNLHEAAFINNMEETKLQLDYAKMMSAILVNLQKDLL